MAFGGWLSRSLQRFYSVAFTLRPPRLLRRKEHALLFMFLCSSPHGLLQMGGAGRNI